MARYFKLVNRFTGKFIVIDCWARRLARMRWKIFAWSEIVKNYYPDYACKMITLTYDLEGTLINPTAPEANDIRDFHKKFKRKYKKDLVALAWVAEVFVSGTLHYHVLAVIPKKLKLDCPDKDGIWDKGMSRVTNSKTGVYYICAHVQKSNQKDFSKYPKGARLFGLWIKVGLDELRKRQADYFRDVSKEEGWMPAFKYGGSADAYVIGELEYLEKLPIDF
jgi:hypothetical protein